MKAKKVSRKTVLKVIWVLFAVYSLVSWLPMADHLVTKDYEKINKYVSLDDSWEITINDEVYQNVSLDDFGFQPVNKGDKIIMRKNLPDDWGIVEGVLRLHIKQTAVSMYLDNEMVYEYGYDRIAKNKSVGNGLQFINFPKEYQGKKLTISLTVSEDKAFTKFDSIRIYEWENVYRVLMTENRIPMLFGCFLIIFGLAMGMTTAFAVVFSLKYVRLLCVSVFSICIGLWTLCYYSVINLFAIPLYSISLMEYVTLYLCPIPLTVYMYEDVKNLKNKVLKRIYWILLAVQILTITVTVALHTADIVHFAATLKYMQVLIVISLLYFFAVVMLNLSKYSPLESRLFLIGMLIIGICIANDLITYWTDRYSGRSVSTIRGLSCMGVIIFIFILIVSFYINLTKKLMQETERNSLIKSAYTDELTQLHNRRYCMEYMNKIKEEQNDSFTVICFDLNNLKKMNDTYGHAKGDILIKSAAEVIAESFEKEGIVARMGGDEFIAVLNFAEDGKIVLLIEAFRNNIVKKNKKIEGLNMSIALGYACSSSQEHDIDKIFQIADDRMYENKKQMKLALGETGDR